MAAPNAAPRFPDLAEIREVALHLTRRVLNHHVEREARFVRRVSWRSDWIRVLTRQESTIKASLLSARPICGCDSRLKARLTRHKKKLTRERTQLRDKTGNRSTQVLSLSSRKRSLHQQLTKNPCTS